jgi:hypothetical protein
MRSVPVSSEAIDLSTEAVVEQVRRLFPREEKMAASRAVRAVRRAIDGCEDEEKRILRAHTILSVLVSRQLNHDYILSLNNELAAAVERYSRLVSAANVMLAILRKNKSDEFVAQLEGRRHDWERHRLSIKKAFDMRVAIGAFGLGTRKGRPRAVVPSDLAERTRRALREAGVRGQAALDLERVSRPRKQRPHRNSPPKAPRTDEKP